MWKRPADAAYVAHDVELPVLVPLLVLHILEARLAGDSDVVHEDVEPTERSCGFRDRALGLAWAREVGDDVGHLAGTRRVPATARNDEPVLGGQLTHDLEPDPARRAGHETPLAGESEIHALYRIPMAMTIVLVRHGETDWNREHRFQGHADTPLNEAGRAQAAELAEILARESLSAVYTSPLRRASETAAIVATRLELDVRPLEALREIHVGDWEGLTVDEVKERYPESASANWHAGWPGGETYDELGARVLPALLGLADVHPGERILAVTHAGPVRAALAAAMGLSYDDARPIIGSLENCVAFRLAVREGKLERVD
jgi:broad specificity phosphatase PhoE